MPSAWLHEQALVPEPIRLRPQKLEKRILRLHDAAALRKLLGYKPKSYVQWRAHAVACTILDSGCRIKRAVDRERRRLRLLTNCC